MAGEFQTPFLTLVSHTSFETPESLFHRHGDLLFAMDRFNTATWSRRQLSRAMRKASAA
jgi:hypothetical protein